MKRIFGSFSKRSASSLDSPAAYPDDSPEGVILREVNAFCEAGVPGNSQGTEFVHLPGIVESAESSPNAAREAAHRIRRILSDAAAVPPANTQYNAIMLIRILVDNPGHTFTRNIDAKFVAAVKDLLRQGKDPNVQHFLRDTLDSFDTQRSWDEDLSLLLQMWRKEKTKLTRTNSGSTWRSQPSSPQPQGPRSNYFNVRQTKPSLPPPDELAARVSEAKTSAKLLIQFVQSTPPAEMLENELIKEFSDRCRVAARAMENYIHSTTPAPDEDTLVTLIEANDELSAALSKHQHAILKARKALGQAGSQSPSSSDDASASGALRPVPPPPVSQPQSQWQAPTPSAGPFAAPPVAGFPPTNNGAAQQEYRPEDFQVQNPFADNFSSTNAPTHVEPARMDGPSNEWWSDPQRPIQRT